MFTEMIRSIVEKSKENGWILEPDAKTLLAEWGLPVPQFRWVSSIEEAIDFAKKAGYPVVAKVVSPKIIHKSDAGGVITDIKDDVELKQAYERLSHLDGFSGILVEENLPQGIELIVGAKNDVQFGPVVLLGMGGTAVEIYHDVELRLAPLGEGDVRDMITCLKAGKLLQGYRGASPVDLDSLVKMIVSFSNFAMEIETYFESVDLNPTICLPNKCVVADARIMLK